MGVRRDVRIALFTKASYSMQVLTRTECYNGFAVLQMGPNQLLGYVYHSHSRSTYTHSAYSHDYDAPHLIYSCNSRPEGAETILS